MPIFQDERRSGSICLKHVIEGQPTGTGTCAVYLRRARAPEGAAGAASRGRKYFLAEE